jgi:putative ABC transport system permease protein
MAVRMALGAQARQVQAMVLAQALRPVLIGAATGLAIALAFNRIISSMLFGITSADLLYLARFI